MRRTLLRSLVVPVGVAALTSALAAQSLYEIDGAVTMTWKEFAGPPAACGYPSGPVLFSAPHIQAAPCLPLNPFGPPPNVLFGDITDNMIKDRVYVTDGKSVAEYIAATGVQTNVMPVAGVFGTAPITGLGFDSPANILWITDGIVAFGVTPSPSGSCLPPALAIAPFPLVGPATDIAWVPSVGIVVTCDAAGFVAGYTPAGVVAVAPYFAAGPCGGLVPSLTGIAADTSTGCTGTPPVISLTNGTIVSRQFLGGGIAPPTFYQTAPCSLAPTPGTEGLAYAARPLKYGAGTGPSFTAIGQSCLPSPGFTLSLTGAPPAAMALLFVGSAAACPALGAFGQPLYVSPIASILGPFPVAGSLTLPAALPPPGGAFTCGLQLYMQWFVHNNSTLAWTCSNGLEMTLSLP